MNNSRRRHTKISGKSFIILPLIFFVAIYLLIYLVLTPYSYLLSAAGMMFSDEPIDYSTEYNNIFVPVPTEPQQDNNTQSEPTNKTIPISEIQYPKAGEQFGELIIEDCSIDNKLFFGDENIALRNGVGVYNGSFIPGYGKTILVAGHNNTYFNGLKNAEVGQTVTIRTSYGNYTYHKLLLGLVIGTISSIWVIQLELGDFTTLLISAILFFGTYGGFLLVTKEPLAIEIFNQVVKGVSKRIGIGK